MHQKTHVNINSQNNRRKLSLTDLYISTLELMRFQFLHHIISSRYNFSWEIDQAASFSQEVRTEDQWRKWFHMIGYSPSTNLNALNSLIMQLHSYECLHLYLPWIANLQSIWNTSFVRLWMRKNTEVVIEAGSIFICDLWTGRVRFKAMEWRAPCMWPFQPNLLGE